ncbi:MAG: hypothetical protein ACJ71H_04995 [Nitrososphaeraceae archaeon]
MQGLNKYQRLLYKELKKVFTESAIDNIEWYTDKEDDNLYIWTFEALSYKFVWTLNKTTNIIDKQENKIKAYKI